jgi:CRP/FNR family cyclic AMP-dependent transcriptional regulator
VDGQGVAGPGDAARTVPSRWDRGARARHHPSSYQYLLDLDADLADEFDVRMRMVARTAVAAITFDVDPGELPVTEWLAAAAGGPGLLVLDGVIAVSVRVGDRIATELVGGSDLLQPRCEDEDVLIACNVEWRALVPSRFAMLDGAFAERVKPWPQITSALLRRAGRRAHNLDVQRAIASQPRLEVRLALLLWHLAARWGKVEPGGIHLCLPLTHQLLGRLVGAERPSVSHALARLAQAQLVTGQGHEWHLHGSLGDQLATMIDPGATRVDRLVARIAGGGSADALGISRHR